MSATWKRIEPFVDEALDADAGEREALLDRLARDDPPLARDVEAFLAAERAARAFMAVPVGEQAVLLLGRAGEVEHEGEEIGPYRVARELGRGGMGAVFLAHRVDGQFEQEVALKLVKRGMDSAEIVERFRAERQILARLHAVVPAADGGGRSRPRRPSRCDRRRRSGPRPPAFAGRGGPAGRAARPGVSRSRDG